MSKLNFSLTQLEYALAVHRFGNFSQAAKHCLVTQPTLSMQIQKLEESLGVVLFDRAKKPILLTEPGARLLSQMQAIVAEAKKVEELLGESVGGPVRGELTLGVIPTVAPYLLPRLLPKVQELFPELRLKIFELQTHRVVESLDTDEIDVGVLATPLRLPRVHERALYWEPFSVLCQKGHPLAKSKSVKYSALDPGDIWLLEEGHCLRHQVLDVCALRKKGATARQFQFESGSLETLKSLVGSYGGYTLLPQLATENLAPNVTLLSFERPVPAREIGLVCRRPDLKKRQREALAESILASIPESVRKIRKKDLELIPVE